MDNGPEDYFGWGTGNQWRDAYNTNLDYNISPHDIPQSFATALTCGGFGQMDSIANFPRMIQVSMKLLF